MKFPGNLFRSASILVSAFFSSQLVQSAEEIVSGATIIVLDASGSMDERIKGESKMSIAKRAVRELVEGLPDNVQLGLVVYSHRKLDDCDDIELLIPPGSLNKTEFVGTVDAIRPRGRTPISAAVEFAAKALDYGNVPANIVLLSDGVETCRKDPCATVARLSATGKRFVVHAVAFDVSAKEAKTFECLSATTGGRFLQASDAASLRDALQLAVLESTTPPPAEAPPAEDLTAATIIVPPRVAMGAAFVVEWTGPDNPGDYITIVPNGAAEDAYANLGYTRQGSPLPLTALADVGPAEVRYLTGRSRKVLGRASLEITAVETTLSAPGEAIAGALVDVSWKGPGNMGDYVTIVVAGAPDDVDGRYAYTRDGETLRVGVPIEAGPSEIRYISGQGRKVLARRPITIVAPTVTLDAADEVVAGSRVAITWTGPDNQGDYVTIVPAGAADGSYKAYSNTSSGSPLLVTAPIDAGECEIRYISGQGAKVLARRQIKVVNKEVTLAAVEEAVAGAPVAITWTGPNNGGDYVTIVPVGAPEGSYKDYNTTSAGSPLLVKATIEPGECEIRYVTGQGAKTLARLPLRVVAAEIHLQAPASLPVGAPLLVEWTGPNNGGDYITIVPKGAPDGNYGSYANTNSGSPAKLVAPKEAGPCEVRYVNGAARKVLKSIPIEVTP